MLVQFPPDGDEAALRARVRQLFDRLQKDHAQIRLEVARRMVDPYNRSWRESDESEIGAATLAASFILIELAYYSDGEVELTYDGGGRFGGHSVMATLDENGAISEAFI
jgi:hypothetical protein